MIAKVYSDIIQEKIEASKKLSPKVSFVLILLCFLNACRHSSEKPQSSPPLSYEQTRDPFEPMNRKIFAFNRVVDGLVLEPFANIYRMTVHEDLQRRVSSFLYNLGEPVTIANDLLQAKKEKGLEAFSRFMINTTFGLFGLFDVAEKLGIPRHQEDFGQTLCVWGLSTGPYLIIPLLGSSTPTALVGRMTDFYLSPYNYYMVHHNRTQYIYVRLGVDTLVKRAQYADDIKNFRENSVDFYAAVRSFYLQNQQARLENRVKETAPAPTADAFNEENEDLKFLED